MTDQDKPLWRTGREDTRAIFRADVCQGRMNDTETASVIVRTMNGDAAKGETELRAKLAHVIRYADPANGWPNAGTIEAIMDGTFDPRGDA